MRSSLFTRSASALIVIFLLAPAVSTAQGQRVEGEIRRELEIKGRASACVVLKDKSQAGDLPERKFQKHAETQQGLLLNLSTLPRESYTVRYRYRFSPVIVLDVKTKDVLDKLETIPDVARVHPDLVGDGALVQSKHMIRADIAADLGFTQSDRIVAVLDSGVDTDHPDIEDAIIHQFHFIHLPNGMADMGPGAEDGHSHGSNVTGIIAGRGRVASPGVAPGTLIVAVKVLDDDNLGYISDWTAGMEHVVSLAEDGMRIDAVNMSLATRTLFTGVCDDSFPAFSAACSRAQELGIAIFAASGNNGRTAQMAIPACYSSVYAVGSVFDSLPDQISSFTNRNRYLDLLAPGDCVTSMGLSGSTSTFQGTSQATPHATAVACLLRKIEPGITPAEILETLKTTGVPVEDTATGLTFPRIDALAAVLSRAPGEDCNQNGEPDLRDIYTSGASLDCNKNRVPDECDLDAGTSRDCDQNGIPDECELIPSFALGPGVEIATEDGPTAVVAANLDGDGALDLAVTNTYSDSVSVHHNSGNGTFLKTRSYPVGYRPGPLVAGDLDGDDNPDLVVGNSGSSTIPGTTVTVFYQRAQGTFELADFTVNRGPSSLALADLDGDDDLDLVVGHSASRDVLILLNDGAGSFATGANISLGVEVAALIVGKLDGDRDPDLAVAAYGSDKVLLFWNDGQAAFTAGEPLTVGGTPSPFIFGHLNGDGALIGRDLDGDGDIDLATANFNGNNISVLLQDEDGSFLPAVNYPVGGGPGKLATADLEGDQDLDLISANRTCRDISVFLNLGDGNYIHGDSHRLMSSPRSVTVVDLDGRGGPEVVPVTFHSDTLAVLANQSRAATGRDCNQNGRLDDCDIGSGASLDDNRDGVPDECPDQAPAGFHRGDSNTDGIVNIGDGIFFFNHLFLGGRAPACREAADSDNDGHLDISDGIGILNFLFLGGPPPAPPGPTNSLCGLDPDPPGSPEDLGCSRYDHC